MRPTCNRCGLDIIWEGFDMAVHEHLCGLCIVTMRIGAERERERIIALLEANRRQLTTIENGQEWDIAAEVIALIKEEQS